MWLLFTKSDAQWEERVASAASEVGLEPEGPLTGARRNGNLSLEFTSPRGETFRVSRLGTAARMEALEEAATWPEEVQAEVPRRYVLSFESSGGSAGDFDRAFLTALQGNLDALVLPKTGSPAERPLFVSPRAKEESVVPEGSRFGDRSGFEEEPRLRAFPESDGTREAGSEQRSVAPSDPSPFQAVRRALSLFGVALILPSFIVLCIALFLLKGATGAWLFQFGLTDTGATLLGIALLAFAVALVGRMANLEKGLPETSLEKPTPWGVVNLFFRFNLAASVVVVLGFGLLNNSYIPAFFSGLLALAFGVAWFIFGPENVFVRWFRSARRALFWYYFFAAAFTLIVLGEGVKVFAARKGWERLMPEVRLDGPLSVRVEGTALLVANGGRDRGTYLFEPETGSFRRFRQEPDDGTSLSYDPYRGWVWMTHDHGGRVSFFHLKKELWYEFESPPGRADYLYATESRAVLLHEKGAFARDPQAEAESFSAPAQPGEARLAEVARYGGLPEGLVKKSTLAGGGPCRILRSAHRHPGNEQLFLVGCAAEGVFLTENGGTTFRPLGFFGTDIVGLSADYEKREVIATVQALLFHEGIFRRKF